MSSTSKTSGCRAASGGTIGTSGRLAPTSSGSDENLGEFAFCVRAMPSALVRAKVKGAIIDSVKLGHDQPRRIGKGVIMSLIYGQLAGDETLVIGPMSSGDV